jgi:hypothetical protein
VDGEGLDGAFGSISDEGRLDAGGVNDAGGADDAALDGSPVQGRFDMDREDRERSNPEDAIDGG